MRDNIPDYVWLGEYQYQSLTTPIQYSTTAPPEIFNRREGFKKHFVKEIFHEGWVSVLEKLHFPFRIFITFKHR